MTRTILKAWLSARVECFLILLILCFARPAHGIDITLEWNPNAEPDLSGYKIYYKTASPGPQYDGWEALEGDSPIIVDAHQVVVGNMCRFTLSDLDESQVYYFAVSAYDAEGNESDYSNEVCFNCTSEYECSLTPDTFVVQRGERIGIDVAAINRADQAGTIYFATNVTKPSGQSVLVYGPVHLYLGPHESKLGHISHSVPMDWPLGQNVYQGYVSMPGVGIVHECEFIFEVNGTQ